MKNKGLFQKYLHKVRTLDDKNYLFSTIAYNIAPTIIGKKPSSLVCFSKNIRNLQLLWEKYKQEFQDSSTLEFYEIRKTEKSTLVLFYNPQLLSNVVFEKNNIKFLEEFGYNKHMTLHQCLELLKGRFEESCPHESGIFLGFPVEDVKSFIACEGKDCLACGYWKVYHNPTQAINMFKAFDHAKMRVVNLIINGTEAFSLINSHKLVTDI